MASRHAIIVRQAAGLYLGFPTYSRRPVVSGRAEQRKMRRNGHRHTLVRLSWRKTAGALTTGLPGVVAVPLVLPAFGGSRGASSGKTFRAVTTDSSLLRFVLGTSSVSVSVTGPCIARELNSGTASLPAGTIIRVADDDSTCLAYLPVAGNCGDRGDATSAQCLVAYGEAGPTSSITQDADVLAVTLARMTVTDLNRLDSN